MHTKKYIVRYSTKSLAHIVARQMEKIVRVLIVIVFIIYLTTY